MTKIGLRLPRGDKDKEVQRRVLSRGAPEAAIALEGAPLQTILWLVLARRCHRAGVLMFVPAIRHLKYALTGGSHGTQLS